MATITLTVSQEKLEKMYLHYNISLKFLTIHYSKQKRQTVQLQPI